MTRPTDAQLHWLCRGLDQAGGKLPLFDQHGRRVSTSLIRRCLEAGWAEPWFANPTKPDWLVCRLTAAGHALATAAVERIPAENQELGSEQPPL